MKKTLYVGTMPSGIGAVVSKIPFEPISLREFHDDSKNKNVKVISYDCKHIRLLDPKTPYSMSDFEFTSYSMANMLCLIHSDSEEFQSLERGTVTKITVTV